VQLYRPDVMLLDLMLPCMDGWETCRRIREFSDVPILMLTARAQLSDREKGFACGAGARFTGWPTGPAIHEFDKCRLRRSW